MMGTALIILFSILAWRGDFQGKIGIPVTAKQILYSSILLILFIISAYFFVSIITKGNNISMKNIEIHRIKHIFFYTLNEELILGGLLLLALKSKFNKLNQIIISTIVALLFAVLHYVVYRWIFKFPPWDVMTLLTILSLFMIGVVRNNLILKTGHIGYSWALHFGWIVIMFGFDFVNSADGFFLSEVERFNMYIGNGKTFILALLMAVLSTLWLETGRDKTKVNCLRGRA